MMYNKDIREMIKMNEELDEIDLAEILEELEGIDLDEPPDDFEGIRMPTELDLKEWEWRGDW
jgi:hypothetical protein